MKIEISPGELFDRLTILEIKLERITSPDKLVRVRQEYDALRRLRDEIETEDIGALVTELKETNAALWQIEDELRDHERRQDFGSAFVELARAVYFNNDRRTDLKRRINQRLGSELGEEKSYSSY